jgi:hypothetical protein
MDRSLAANDKYLGDISLMGAMIAFKDLLDIVATEALEGPKDVERKPDVLRCEYRRTDVPPIRYNLELIRKPDGTLYWVE